MNQFKQKKVYVDSQNREIPERIWLRKPRYHYQDCLLVHLSVSFIQHTTNELLGMGGGICVWNLVVVGRQGHR